jgi:NADPH-dependent 2,4-dienoyl-CoA reductase/sulfur reductase-like enzyme
MAAAISARKSGASVAVIDDNHTPGGQIWRGGGPFPDFASSGAHFIPGARVIDAGLAAKQLTVESEQMFAVRYSKLILATGARELFLPFPGWTLPGVFGVGGLQALAKSGLPVAGKRIVVAGTGPLLLAVAAYLVQHGATVPLIAEQASWRSLAGFGRALLSHPSKIKQAVEIKKSIWRTRYLPNCWVTRAEGANRVERVTLLHNGTSIEEACDYLAIGYGFVPNSELAQLLGCELSGGLVKVDQNQQTSVPGIYCAGEPTGLGGVDEAQLEGEIAGYAATGRFPGRSRKSTNHFSAALNQGFALRPEIRAAVNPDTIICRCEDVTFARLLQANSWREAKLHFRCGMGPCQGRVCGPAVEYLFGWKPESVRPPIFPCRLETLI